MFRLKIDRTISEWFLGFNWNESDQTSSNKFFGLVRNGSDLLRLNSNPKLRQWNDVIIIFKFHINLLLAVTIKWLNRQIKLPSNKISIFVVFIIRTKLLVRISKFWHWVQNLCCQETPNNNFRSNSFCFCNVNPSFWNRFGNQLPQKSPSSNFDWIEEFFQNFISLPSRYKHWDRVIWK